MTETNRENLTLENYEKINSSFINFFIVNFYNNNEKLNQRNRKKNLQYKRKLEDIRAKIRNGFVGF